MTDSQLHLVVYVGALLTLAYCATIIAIATVLVAYFSH